MLRYFLASLLLLSPLAAQNAPEVKGVKESATLHWSISERGLVRTEHQITLNGSPLRYRATVGTLKLRDEKGEVTAHMFFTAYDKLGGQSADKRPITFVFNGGPGSSSVWLHLGGIGPKRVPYQKVNADRMAPYGWVDNQDTILDQTDLVFIDPIGTGFSRAIEADQAGQFYEVESDIKAVGAFIRDYLTQFDRWLSPKYLFGESYGTTRAAGLSEYLQEELFIGLNGVVLLSCAVDFSQFIFTPDNVLSQVLYLPSYTAAAWYHKKLSLSPYPTLETAVEQARQFALGDYLLALYQGDQLSEEKQNQIIDQLCQLTGLPRNLVEKNSLRIDPQLFATELFQNSMTAIGRYDSRYKGFYTSADQALEMQDPSSSDISSLITSTFGAYLVEELRFKETEMPYETLNIQVNINWQFPQGQALDLTPSLRAALAYNPRMKLLMLGGLFDLATPFAGMEYTRDHLLLPPALQKQVTSHIYPCGHMAYLDESTSHALKRDLVKFYETP